MDGHKIMSDIQKLEREKQLKQREEMKSKASPLHKKRNMLARKVIDQQTPSRQEKVDCARGRLRSL